MPNPKGKGHGTFLPLVLPTHVAASVTLEGEDSALKVRMNTKVTGSEGSVLPEHGGFGF